MPAKREGSNSWSTEGVRKRAAAAGSATPRRARSGASRAGIPAAMRAAAVGGTGAGTQAVLPRESGVGSAGTGEGAPAGAARGARALPFVVDPERAEPLVALCDQLVRAQALEVAEGRRDPLPHPAAGLGRVGVGAAQRLGDDLVHHPQLQEVGGGQLHGLGGLGLALLVFPQDRGAALGR